jgi:hypothetical protein
VSFLAIKCLFGANGTCVRVNHFEWFVDWEVAHNCAALSQSGVAELASSGIADEMGHMFAHVGPVTTKADSMEGMTKVKMVANWISVKSDEDNISEF